jgi:hypothetical protein
MGGVIADLFEPHQGRQHQSPPAYIVARFFEPPLERFHCRLIERRLLAGEPAIGLHFGLVWQIGDDATVGLHPPEDVRRDELAQRGIRRGRLVGEALHGSLQTLRGAEGGMGDEHA